MKADGTIENNRIERTGCSGILVHPDVFFLENPFPTMSESPETPSGIPI
ncbi:MAG: hypothetical protein L6W00_10890 [Lentisphaeria bacterium]|nr:MAG: hypothetical protein L6W00_10890 [Lentisphaeria bacterium]